MQDSPRGGRQRLATNRKAWMGKPNCATSGHGEYSSNRAASIIVGYPARGLLWLAHDVRGTSCEVDELRYCMFPSLRVAFGGMALVGPADFSAGPVTTTRKLMAVPPCLSPFASSDWVRAPSTAASPRAPPMTDSKVSNKAWHLSGVPVPLRCQ